MGKRWTGAAGRRGKRETGLVAALLVAPWPLSFGLAAAVFVCLKWILPALAAANLVLKAAAGMLAGLAGLFAGAFCLIGGLAFLRQRSAAGNPPEDSRARRPAEAMPPAAAVPEADRQGGTAPAVSKPTAWSLELIRALEWKRFEDVCQQFYEKKGIRSATTPLGPDGGIDIRLYQDDSGRASSIVQCKAWGERTVGVKPVRELLGVMVHEKIGKAFFMTSGAYSDEAKAFAQANHITLIDGHMLLLMFQRLPPAERDSLLSFATAGDYWIPTCPGCGGKMKAHEGKAGRPGFWGCRNYPRCRHTLGMRRGGAGEEAAVSGDLCEV